MITQRKIDNWSVGSKTLELKSEYPKTAADVPRPTAIKPKARLMNPSSPYDRLYEAAQDQVLWGAEPGRLVKRIREFCSGGIVVDAGCGDGKNALFLEMMGFTVIGYDSSTHFPQIRVLFSSNFRATRVSRGY